MMLNNDNFFVWPRFCAYFKKTVKEHWKGNLMLIVLMFAAMLIMVMWMSMQVYSDYYKQITDDYRPTHDPMYDNMGVIAAFFLYVCGCIWSARLMRGFKNKGSRIAILTTPVTQFEAWLTRWIIHVPCFWAVFVVVVLAVDLLRVAVFSPIVVGAPVEMFTLDDSVYYYLLRFYLLTSSLYVLGSVFFPRRPVLMTSVVLFFAGLIYAIVLSFVGTIWNLSAFDYSGVISDMMQVYMVVGAIFCWWLSYRRYKELEIIDRM